jgi:hypothetical protein
MRNKRQLVGGFVLAAMMSVAMPLSASGGGDTETSKCAFLNGIFMKANMPDAVEAKLLALFGCPVE